jgi:hypothetical protein
VFVFLSGAEMQPERVRAKWPQGRFVARGRLSARPIGAAPPPRGMQYETWGILIETQTGAASGETMMALADDGRRFDVIVPPPDAADPAAVLAAARYWELPPVYVRRLMRLANAQVEEYVY